MILHWGYPSHSGHVINSRKSSNLGTVLRIKTTFRRSLLPSDSQDSCRWKLFFCFHSRSLPTHIIYFMAHSFYPFLTPPIVVGVLLTCRSLDPEYKTTAFFHMDFHEKTESYIESIRYIKIYLCLISHGNTHDKLFNKLSNMYVYKCISIFF